MSADFFKQTTSSEDVAIAMNHRLNVSLRIQANMEAAHGQLHWMYACQRSAQKS
jgi:hypothetical protein